MIITIIIIIMIMIMYLTIVPTIQLQSAVVAGTLHCSSDEAIGLAGLQFRIERMTEQNNRSPDSLSANSPDSLLDGCGPCTMLQPISEDKEHLYLQLDVPASPPKLPDDVHDDDANAVYNAAISPTISDEPSTTRWQDFFLRTCRCFFGDRERKNVVIHDPFGIINNVHLYVPPDFRNPKNTIKLIKVSARRAFLVDCAGGGGVGLAKTLISFSFNTLIFSLVRSQCLSGSALAGCPTILRVIYMYYKRIKTLRFSFLQTKYCQ